MTKKTILVFTLVCSLSSGCAFWRSGNHEDEINAAAQTAESQDEKNLNAGLENLKTGIEARGAGKDLEARDAFGYAMRYLAEVSSHDRNIMQNAADELRGITAISAFSYAPKHTLELFIIYMEMQNAYTDHDSTRLQELNKKFLDASELTKDATATAKQKRLESLGLEVMVKKEEVKKEVPAPEVLQTYPGIHVVRKGDTLPSIAARNEIYNDSYMWPLIYKANRDQIKDPKILYTGQDLKIPRDMSMDDIIQARREAGAPEPAKIPKDAVLPRRAR